MERILFYKYNNNFNVINKALPQPVEIQGVLLSNISVLTPTIQIRFTESFSFNYCYLETFQRYYFVESVDYQGDKATLRLQLDVLKTYENEILATIATRVNSGLLSSYSTTYDTTPRKETLQFPNKNLLNANGCYVLAIYDDNNVKYYTLSAQSLQDFAAVKLASELGGHYQYIDLSKFVKNIRRYFVEPQTFTTIRECNEISLGYNSITDIEAAEIENATKRLNFGEILLPRVNNTTIDNKSKFELFLPPFSERLTLDNTLLGERINLVCDFTPENEKARFAVLVDSQEVESKEVVICNNFIYQSIDYYAYLSENKQLLADNLEPFVKMTYYQDLNAPIIPPIDYNNRAQIGSFSGRCAFVDIDIISTETMLASEQQKIYSLLKNEIFII